MLKITFMGAGSTVFAKNVLVSLNAFLICVWFSEVHHFRVAPELTQTVGTKQLPIHPGRRLQPRNRQKERRRKPQRNRKVYRRR